MVILDLILIVIFTVCVVDLSGIITSIKKGLGKFLKIKNYSDINLPLILCSLCCSFHAQWIYLLIIGHFTLINLTISILLSTFTPQIKDIITLIQDAVTKITNKLYDLL